jgi:hypothetical protein
MIVNFRICKINRDTRKLTRTSTLIKKKKPSLFVTIRIANHMIEYYKVFESAKNPMVFSLVSSCLQLHSEPSTTNQAYKIRWAGEEDL